jgi:hypothetical protein
VRVSHEKFHCGLHCFSLAARGCGDAAASGRECALQTTVGLYR